jgi:peptidoglycan/LPS O-acetylase OafA/YrhL
MAHVSDHIVSPAVTPPPGQPRFAGLDGLRGIAILMVVTCHAAGFAGITVHEGGWMLHYLYAGVILFFALSGFLIYRPFVAGHARGETGPELARYARRRVLRIVPAYWVALTVLAVWPGLHGDVLGGQWWRFYLLVHGYAMSTITAGLGVTWSLCVEVAFYALVPVFALGARALARRAGWVWWRAELALIAVFWAVGVAVFVSVVAGATPLWMANSIFSAGTWFSGGMALAVVSVAAPSSRRASGLEAIFARRGGLLWLAALGALVVAARASRLWTNPDDGLGRFVIGNTLSHVLVGVSAALAVAPVVAGAGGITRAVSRWRPLMLLGLISYGVFLWHWPLLAWLHGTDPALAGGSPQLHGFGLLALAGLAAAVAAATLSYRLVELPFLRRKDRAGRAVSAHKPGAVTGRPIVASRSPERG